MHDATNKPEALLPQHPMPFVRYELIEDRFERTSNRNLMGRPEFFPLGLNARVELGWSPERGLGEMIRDAWRWSEGKGF